MHTFCIQKLFPENRAVYEITKILYSRTGHRWRCDTCIAYWINKVADTHSEYVVLVAFPLQQSLQEGATVLPA